MLDDVASGQECSSTIAQLAAELHVLSWRFLGLQLPESVVALCRARFPAPRARRDLDAWDRCERANPVTFFGIYPFWCERDDASP